MIAVFAAGCGGSDEYYDSTVPTQSYPVISRIAPATASAGDTVTLFGFGYSVVPEFNIISIEGVEVFADTYSLLSPPVSGEVESLTFTVPAGLTAGAHNIFVIVCDNPSNTNLALTIN